jgi:hypothetical protein
MLKALQALMGKAPRDDSPKKPASKAQVKPTTTAKDYRSVSVAPGMTCCSGAKELVGKRFLTREGPRLPLPDCTMPATCRCKFKKASDRRDADRRALGEETGRWFAGTEHRKGRGRRTAKD